MRPEDMVLTPTSLRFLGRRFPRTIGRGGVVAAGAKREGDGGTPTGRHRIVACLYRPDRLPPPNGWSSPILPGDLWSDDPSAPDYNHQVRAPYRYGHEALRRADPLYDLVLVTDWNWPDARPGHGSAIFMHRWRRPVAPTAGCVALAPGDLWWIARHLVPGSALVVPER